MIKTIEALCTLSGISGREDSIREYIIERIKDHAEYSVDPLGNIIAFKKGKNPAKNKVMIDAHMDEVGLMITGITSEGFLHFTNVGGIDTKVLLGRSVIINADSATPVNGVIGVKPIHLLKNDDERKIPDKDSLYIDIGASSKEEAEALVSAGDPASFLPDFEQFGNGFIRAKALDDRAGCAILIEMIKSELEYDTWFSFSVQEEVGLRGAAASAFTIAPDYAIAVETTTAADISGVEGEKRVCICGNGPAVSFMDRSTVYSPALYKKALEVADRDRIKCQLKTQASGGNNAGSIHKSRDGVKTLTISVPCRYLHSPSCVIKYEDAVEAYKLVCAMATELASC